MLDWTNLGSAVPNAMPIHAGAETLPGSDYLPRLALVASFLSSCKYVPSQFIKLLCAYRKRGLFD